MQCYQSRFDKGVALPRMNSARSVVTVKTRRDSINYMQISTGPFLHIPWIVSSTASLCLKPKILRKASGFVLITVVYQSISMLMLGTSRSITNYFGSNTKIIKKTIFKSSKSHCKKSKFYNMFTIRFYSDIVKTLPTYYFMLLEYMCEVSKLLTIQNPRKLSLKKRLKMRLNTEFPMLRGNWTTFSITVGKYFLPL